MNKQTFAPMTKSVALLRDNVASLLLANNRSQVQLAEHLGCHPSWVSKLIRGRRTRVSMAYVESIAQYFDVEIHQLFMPVLPALPIGRMAPFWPGDRRKETNPRNIEKKGKGRRAAAKAPTAIQKAADLLSSGQSKKKKKA